MPKKVLITTGGTGGHIYPALSVAECLRDRGVEILFVGSSTRMEKDLVPESGFRFIGLNIKPPRSIRSLLKYAFGMFKGLLIVMKEKPDAIVGFGNYISVPCVLAGILLRKKVYLQEQNANIGGTNRFFYRFAKKMFLAFDSTFEQVPIKYQNKLVVTGNPLRTEINTINSDEERDKLKIESGEKVLVITGGSLGAVSINDGVLENWERIYESKKLRIYWATGEGNYEEITKKLTRIKIIDTIKPYFNNLINIMAAADLVVCRAGALTISEIIQLGKPSILIPYNSKKVGQLSNAEILEENGSGIIFPNSKAEEGIETALNIINDDAILGKMKAKIRNLKVSNAAEKLVDNIDIWRN